MNLMELLAALSDLDDAAEIEIDPAEIVGDIADKVDAIKKVLDRLEMEATRLSVLSDMIKQSAQHVDRNRKRLEEWVRFSMRSQGFERVPGNLFTAQLKRTAPKLVVDQEPTAVIAFAMPDFVRRAVSYTWRKDDIKKAMANGVKFEYGRLQESHSLSFPVRKGT